MPINIDVLLSILVGGLYGSIFSFVLVSLYSWALSQKGSVRISVILFVSFLGPLFMVLHKKTVIFLVWKKLRVLAE